MFGHVGLCWIMLSRFRLCWIISANVRVVLDFVGSSWIML